MVVAALGHRLAPVPGRVPVHRLLLFLLSFAGTSREPWVHSSDGFQSILASQRHLATSDSRLSTRGAAAAHWVIAGATTAQLDLPFLRHQRQSTPAVVARAGRSSAGYGFLAW